MEVVKRQESISMEQDEREMTGGGGDATRAQRGNAVGDSGAKSSDALWQMYPCWYLQAVDGL